MQSDRATSSTLHTSDPSNENLGSHFRWQIVLALVGVFLLATLLSYSPSYNMTTISVPSQGGVFREGIVGQYEYLNPFFCDETGFNRTLCKLVYRGLTKFDNQGRIVPDLARSWKVSDDGLTYTFQLRPNQLWNDGRPVTAKDVVFTINILKDPAIKRLANLNQLWSTVDILQVDDTQVRFTLTDPFAPFLEYTTIGLLPHHVWREKTTLDLTYGPLEGIAVGTGPLRMEEIGSSYIRLVPNPYYSGRTPYISALEFHFFDDHASLFSAFENNEVDGISQILPTDLEKVASRTDLQLHSTLDTRHTVAMFNLAKLNLPFFQDKNVRQALYYAINKERLVNGKINGQAVVADSLFLPTNWAYNPNARQYPYDLQRAVNTLDQAGWIDTNGDGVREKQGIPLQFDISFSDDEISSAIALQVVQDWRSIGVRINPIPLNFLDLIDNVLTPRAFDVALVGLDMSGDPDPYPRWHSTQVGDLDTQRQNYSGWQNPEADIRMEKARTTADEAERGRLYGEFQAIFNEELPALPLLHSIYTYGINERVQSTQIGTLHDASDRFTNFTEWYIVTRRLPANQALNRVPPTPPGLNN